MQPVIPVSWQSITTAVCQSGRLESMKARRLSIFLSVMNGGTYDVLPSGMTDLMKARRLSFMKDGKLSFWLDGLFPGEIPSLALLREDVCGSLGIWRPLGS